MYKYPESPVRVLLGLVEGIVSCVYVWPIDGVDGDASKRVESEAMSVLIYDICEINKPFSLDSCFTVRSTLNDPRLTNNVSFPMPKVVTPIPADEVMASEGGYTVPQLSSG